MSMAVQYFSVEVADMCGVNAAIMFVEIADEVEYFKERKKNFRDGRYWTISSMKSISERFDFLTERQVKTALKKLEDTGLIMTGNYNDTPFDRTKWYALSEMGYSVLNS